MQTLTYQAMAYSWAQFSNETQILVASIIFLLLILLWFLSRKRVRCLQEELNHIKAEAVINSHIYKSLFAASNNGVFFYNNNQLVDCNQQALAMYGRSRKFFEQHFPWNCSPNLQPSGLISSDQSEQIIEKARNGEYQHFEWIHTKANGVNFDAEVTIFPFESEQANLIAVIVRDITEKKTLERSLYHTKNELEQIVYDQTEDFSETNKTLNKRNSELANANFRLNKATIDLRIEVEEKTKLQLLLQESQSTLQSFIEQSPLGICIISEELNIIVWNPALVTVTGISEKDAIGKSVFQIYAQLGGSHERTTSVRAFLKEFFDSSSIKKTSINENNYTGSNETSRTIQHTLFAIHTPSSKLLGVVSKDITYQKMLEAKQVDYSKQLDDLLIKQAETSIDLYQKLSTIFNNTNTSIAFFTIKKEGIYFATCNTTWAETININISEIEGKCIDNFYNTKEVSLFTNAIHNALDSQRKINNEVIWENGGKNYYLDFTTIPIDSEATPEVKQVACIFRDITEKRIMEQALQEREAHLARAQELAHIGSWKWDLTTNEMLLSKEMERIYDFNPSRPDELPNAIFQYVHPNDFERLEAHVNYAKQHITSGSIEHRIVINGKEKHLLVLNDTIANSNGIPTIIEGTTQDVTTQKLLEQSIRESEEKFRKIFNSSLDAITLIDCKTNRYYDVNDQFVKFTGIEKRDAIGKTREELNVWARKEERDAYDNIILTQGGVINFRMHWVVQGSPRNFLISTEKICFNEKEFFLTISIDIDEQQQLGIALEESEAKFRNIFNASADGILLMTTNHKFIDCNPALLQLIGYEKDELVNLSPFDFIPKFALSKLHERATLMRHNTITPTIEIQLLRRNQKPIPVEISTSSIAIGGKQIFLTQVRDLSERKKLEEQLITRTIEAEENERRKLAQDLHDDVGPLLSSMNMYLSILARKPDVKPYEPIVKDIEKILKETMTSVREISNSISPHILANYGLIEALISFFKNNERLIPVSFTSNLAHDRLPALMETMLFRIIKEAYNNTIKHANATTIDLNISKQEQTLTIEYRDNGNGFDMTARETSRLGGLGLHNIQSRLSTMDDQFSLETAPGKGFYLYITIALD